MDKNELALLRARQLENHRSQFKKGYPKYPYFRSQVTRHDPTELLKEVASIATQLPEFSGKPHKGFNPWSLAAIARDSLVHGSKHQDIGVDEQTVGRLTNLFNEFSDDETDDDPFLIRMVKYLYEQFPYHTSRWNDLARTYLLLEDTKLSGNRDQGCDWENAIGGKPSQVIKAVFVIYVFSRRNRGTFPKGELRGPEWKNVDNIVPLKTIEAVRDSLTINMVEAKLDYRSNTKAAPNRYSYNPLASRPLVDLGEDHLIAPQPHLILGSMAMDTLYYVGAKRGYLEEMGYRVDAYTGRLFSRTNGLNAYPEVVTKRRGKGTEMSIDWVIVTKNTVVLVECKSAYMNEVGRSGKVSEVVARNEIYVSGARKQINRTYKEITDGNPAFNHMWSTIGNRKFYGLIVTGGPFHASNSSIVSSRLKVQPDIPTIVASLHEVEILASLSSSEIDDVLMQIHHCTKLSEMNLDTAIGHLPGGNELLKRRHWLVQKGFEATLPQNPERVMHRGESFNRAKVSHSCSSSKPRLFATVIPDHDSNAWVKFDYADHYLMISGPHE